MRVSTGVRRLDELLKGGLPEDSSALMYGPAFLGKELLARKTIVAALETGVPVVLVLTNTTVEDMRRDLLELDAKFVEYEEKGLISYVDAYSQSIGAPTDRARAEFLDSIMDLNAVSVAVNKMQREIVPVHDNHLIVIDSISTFIAQTTAQTAFRFLQVFLGRTRLVGAVNILLMDEGMHSDAELQMFKHLVSGMISLRDNGGKPQLLVQGLGTAGGMNWVDYTFDQDNFEITGSFAAGRIR